MDKAAVLDALRRFRKALAAQGVSNCRLILYGSHANGTAREDSDIDVVVVSDAFAGMPHWERITLLSKAICASEVLIEAVSMTRREWDEGDSLIAEFAREGQEIQA
jgi:hypothetical protein